MPPKGSRGRGGARGGRGGRAGASAARADASAPTPAPPELKEEPTTTSEEANGKPEPGEANSALIESDVSATIEGQPSDAVDVMSLSSASTPQTVAEYSTRPPVQRLESLKSLEPASRSASPSTRRNTPARGKKPAVIKPTFTGRRSKQDRDALDKMAREREKERAAEREALEKAKREEKAFQGRKRGNGRGDNNSRGRGGYSGAVSGPFSLGATQERKREGRITVSGSRAQHVKREDYDGEGGGGGGGRSSSRGGTGIKKEDGGYVSSGDDDDDEDAEFPRKDIDLIEISSDEEIPDPSASKERAQRVHGPSMLLPVRIGRREHLERVVGINTEASSEASAQILQQAEASGSEVKVETDEGATRKGKKKVKDLEITGVRKPYKGMWQDGDESHVPIKAEPLSDDEDMADAEPVGISESSNSVVVKPSISSPETEKKTKARRKPATEPVLQTDEEKAEWERIKKNLESVRAELGPEPEQVADASGDAIMADTAAGEVKRSVRDNNAYLFHFPPRMPNALHPEIKKEQVEPTQNNSNGSATTNGAQKGVKIKTEEVQVDRRRAGGLCVAPGVAGKLRVHESGRTTLRWGGETFELNPGNPAAFMQEVIEVETVPQHLRVVQNEGGETTSFGRVKGKFVVMPSWRAML